jgi:hypothetical protein
MDRLRCNPRSDERCNIEKIREDEELIGRMRRLAFD